MKPLMGQAQNSLNLDDLFNSSRVQPGNFGRSRVDSSPRINADSSKHPNFSDLLLRNLQAQKSDQATPQRSIASDLRPNQSARPEETAQGNRQKPAEAPATSLRDNKPLTNTRTAEKSDSRSSFADQQPTSNNPKSANGASNSFKAEMNTADPAQEDDLTSKTSLPISTEDRRLVELNKNSSENISHHQTLNGIINPVNGLDSSAISAALTDGLLTDTQPIDLSALIKDDSTVASVSVDVGNLAQTIKPDATAVGQLNENGAKIGSAVPLDDIALALSVDAGEKSADSDLNPEVPFIGDTNTDANQLNSPEQINVSPELISAFLNQSNQTLSAAEQLDAIKASSPAVNVNIKAPITFSENLANILSEQGIATTADLLNPLDTSAELKNIVTPQEQTENLQEPQEITPLNLPDMISDSELDTASETSDLQAKVTDESILQALQSGASLLANISSRDQNSTQINSPGSPANLGRVSAVDTSENQDFETTPVIKDPFAKMAGEIDQKSATKIEFSGNGTNNRSLEEILLDRNVDVAIQDKLNTSSSSENLNRVDDISDRPNIPNGEISELPLSEAKGTIDSSEVRLNTADSNTVRSTTSFSQEFSSGSDSGTSGNGHQTIQDLPGALVDRSREPRASEVSFSSKISEQTTKSSQPNLAQKILGQAEIMFKNGGGSMRMDMEAPGIGKVDVAINLNNNQLDVRIMTASDQARDIISREVAGLRDGLTQQGISLRGLEVGKAGESSSRNFAGNGGQQFGQGAQDQRATYNDMKEYVQSFRNSYAPRNNSFSASKPAVGGWTNMATGSGSRLEVRV